MPTMFKAGMGAVLMAAVAGAGVQSARAAVDLQDKADQVVKCMVPVEYTLRNQNASQEESGLGLVVSKEGVILISGSLIPESLPKEWIKDIKVRVPGKDFASVPAKFLGRTRDRLFAYMKTTEPIDASVFDPGEMADVKLGEQVFSPSMASKNGGYETMVGVTRVKAMLHLSHVIVGTDSFGLTRGTAPVYDLDSGACVGIAMPATGDSMLMRDATGVRRIDLIDEDQTSLFLPREEVDYLFKNIPTQPFEQKRAWLAVDEVTGLEEDVREGKGIKQPAGVMIGAVIPGEAADKAGLKPRDIVLTIDGKEFSKSPVPDLMVTQFTGVLDRHKPGDTVTLGILRDGQKQDIKVTLGEFPKMGSDMPYVFASKVGVVTRDLVFTDLYARRLPNDTKGVMVALVKNGSPAALGTTPLRTGMLITKVDDQTVENEKAFTDLMDKETAKPDLKEMVFSVILPSGDTQVCRVDLTK
ncbi:MAG TPA: PDZ domain-containing protein [Phycisphaerae bacterium]|nr:PDZ domain-containing protein [Phycisphaerae bacterium]